MVCVVIQCNFAIGAVVAALGLPAIDPLCFALIREVGAAALLLGAAWLLGEPAPRLRGFPPLARVGVFAFGTQLLAILGLKLSADPTVFALYQPAQPAIVAAASVALGWERPDRSRAAGVVLAAAGCAVAAAAKRGGGGGGGGGGGARDLAAHLCFAGSSLSGALYQLASRPAVRQFAPLVVAAYSYAFAATCTGAAALFANVFWPASRAFLCPECAGEGFWAVPSSAVPALLWWIFMSTALNYALMMWAVKRSSPTLVTVFTALQPPLAAGCALAVVAATRGRVACRAGGPARCVALPTAADAAAAILVVGGLYAVARSELRSAGALGGAGAYAAVDRDDAGPPPPPAAASARPRKAAPDLEGSPRARREASA